MKYIKKIFAIGVGFLFIASALVGCTTPTDMTPVNEALNKLDELGEKIGDIEQTVADMQIPPGPLEPIAEMPQEIVTDVKQVATEEGGIPETEVAPEEVIEVKLHEFDIVDDLDLGQSVPATEFKNKDLKFLNVGEFKFDNEDIDYKEYLFLNGDMEVAISSVQDKELGDDPALFYEKGAFGYRLEFNDEILVEDISKEEPLEINFMGMDLEIIEIEDGEVKVINGVKGMYYVGDTLELDGKTWTVHSINKDNEITLRAESEFKRFEEGDLKRLGDTEVYAEEIYYDEDVDSLAFLRVGKEVMKELKDGYEIDDLGEDYIFSLEVDEGVLKSMSVTYDVRADEADEALLIGETLNFGGFATVELALEEDYEYIKYDFSFDEVEDTNVLKIECDGDRCLEVDDEEMSVAYLAIDNTVFYRDDDNEWVNVEDTLYLVNDDMEYSLSVTEGVIQVGEFDLMADASFEFFGLEEGEAEQGDVFFDGDGVGKREEDMLLEDGVIVRNVEDNMEDDEFVMEIPNEEVKAVLKVGR